MARNGGVLYSDMAANMQLHEVREVRALQRVSIHIEKHIQKKK